jgi:hypothetical protein
MVAGELDAGLNFTNGIVDEPDGSPAMPTFVSLGLLERLARRSKMIERRLHVRLPGAARAPDEVSAHQSEKTEDGEDNRSFAHEILREWFWEPGRTTSKETRHC